MGNISLAEVSKKRQEELLQELLDGKHKIDKLPNASFEFVGERQAIYFSHTRKNMCSDIAHMLMQKNQQLDDVRVLEELRRNE